MTGYELRIWRAGMGWTQERAAEETGMCLRAYKNHETRTGGTAIVPRWLELATCALQLRESLPELENLDASHILSRLKLIAPGSVTFT